MNRFKQLDSTLRRNWFVACTSQQLKARPLSSIILQRPIVLSRTGDGLLVAEDRCPHRNAPLSSGFVEEGILHCPYHGWGFDHKGKCTKAPGLASGCVPSVGLLCWKAVEQDDLIWVAPPDTPLQRLPYRTNIEKDRFDRVTLVASLQAEFSDAIENLLDGTHTPYVHQGLIRSAKHPQRFRGTVRRITNGVEAEYRGESKQRGFVSKWFEREREASFGRFLGPCTAELEYRSKSRTELFVSAHFTPSDHDRTQVFVTAYVPKGFVPGFVQRAFVRILFGSVLKQDKRILELQTKHVARFQERAYTYWDADLIRPWIDAYLATGEFPEQTDAPKEVEFLL